MHNLRKCGKNGHENQKSTVMMWLSLFIFLLFEKFYTRNKKMWQNSAF